jgi:hypothetical protein
MDQIWPTDLSSTYTFKISTKSKTKPWDDKNWNDNCNRLKIELLMSLNASMLKTGMVDALC